MQYELTVPGLQSALDRLPPHQTLALAKKRIEHLFGTGDDTSAARLERFARGHSCTITHSGDSVVFLKVASVA